MAGGKQKGKVWNPFKRSHRKQKLLEGHVLDSYENGLCSKSSETSSKVDGFSVTSLHNGESQESDSTNESGISIPPKPAPIAEEIKEKKKTTLETKIIGDTDASFDSFFGSAVEVDLQDGSSFFNDPFMASHSALQHITTNNQILNVQGQQGTLLDDLEDFDSAIFDPLILSQVRPGGTPKSLLRSPRLFRTVNDNENVDIVGTSDSEKENDFEFKFTSPVSQDADRNFFNEKGGGKSSRNANSDVRAEDKRQESLLGTDDDEGQEERFQEQITQTAPLQTYRNLMLSKRKKSRPFRSRLKNVLGTKAVANTAQTKSPSGDYPDSANTDPLSETRHQVSATNAPRTPNSTPAKSTTTPRSKKIWSKSKSATPRSDDKAQPGTMTPVSVQSCSSSKQTEHEHVGKLETYNGNKEITTSSTPAETETSSMQQHSLDEKAAKEEVDKQELISRATTFSHRETPRNRSIEQSNSEIPFNTVSEKLQNEQTTCATAESYEIEDVKLSETRTFCCSPRYALPPKKLEENCKSSETVDMQTHKEQERCSPLKKETGGSDSNNRQVAPPPPPPPPPLPKTNSSSSSSIKAALAAVPPPPPPPRPAEPPRLVVVRPMEGQAKVDEVPDQSPRTIARSNDQAEQGGAGRKGQRSFDDKPEVFLGSSEEDIFYPAESANSMENHVPTFKQGGEDINPSDLLEGAINDLSNMLDTTDSERLGSFSDSLSQALNSDLNPSTDVSNDGKDHGRKPKSRLRKSFGKMGFLKGKKKKKECPAPRNLSNSSDNMEDPSETPLVEWFDTQNSKISDQSTFESTKQESLGNNSIAGNESEQNIPSGVQPRCIPATATSASGLIKVAANGKTPSSNLIYWSGSTDDFEVVAVAPSKDLAAESESWVDGGASYEPKEGGSKPTPDKLKQKPTPDKLKQIKEALNGAHSAGCGDIPKAPYQSSKGTAFTPSGAGRMNKKNTPQNQGTPFTRKGQASPRTNRVLAMLGQPGVKPKPPRIGDTIAADMFISACSTLSDSSSSNGSTTSGSYSASDDDDEGSCASDSAILAPSEIVCQEKATGIPNLKSGLQAPNTSSLTPFCTSTSNDSDDDIFSNIDDGSTEGGTNPLIKEPVKNQARFSPCRPQVNQEMGSGTRTSRMAHPIINSHSMGDGTLSTSSSADYSSDSRTVELNDIEAHMQMAQEWLQKIKTALLGNDDDDSAGHGSTFGNTLQCEYAGVLGRLKIDLNQPI